MLRSAALLTCTVLLASPSIAQSKLEATDIANHPFSADFAAGGKLRLRVRSADVHIIGTAENKISVELSGRSAHEARKLKVQLARRGGTAEMRICGGPRNDLKITIRIPSDTDLHARGPLRRSERRERHRQPGRRAPRRRADRRRGRPGSLLARRRVHSHRGAGCRSLPRVARRTLPLVPDDWKRPIPSARPRRRG